MRSLKDTIAENTIESSVGRVLEAHYPGWRWYVEAHLDGGVVSVKNLDLSGEYGFMIHLSKLKDDPELKVVMRAGGEVLERYKQHRAARPHIINVNRDIRGEAIGDTN